MALGFEGRVEQFELELKLEFVGLLVELEQQLRWRIVGRWRRVGPMVRGTSVGLVAVSLVWIGLSASEAAAQQRTRPDPYPDVSDAAGVFDRETRRQLTDVITTVNRETRAQIAVATVAASEGEPLSAAARRLYAERGLGLRGVSNGVLVVVAPATREAYIQVGSGLRRVLTEDVTRTILDTELLPSVRDERVEEGALRSVRAISDILLKRYTLSPEELRLLDELGPDPATYAIVALLGILVGASGLLAGFNARNKTVASILAGVLIGILLMFFTTIMLPLSAVVIAPLFIVLAVVGFRRNIPVFNLRRDSRGRRVANATTWEWGARFFRQQRHNRYLDISDVMRQMKVMGWLLIVAALAVARPAAAQPSLPSPTGRVNDFASVLDDSSERQLDALLARLEEETTAEVAVATVSSLDGITVDEYANRLFNAWGVGQRGKDNGVLVLVATSAREMRIEVGYGLEGVLPDGLSGQIFASSSRRRSRRATTRAASSPASRASPRSCDATRTLSESERQGLSRRADKTIDLPSWVAGLMFVCSWASAPTFSVSDSARA